MSTNKKRIVSWIAVSSEEQAKRASPAQQRADNAKFVNETLPLTYGVSGEIIAELELADSRSIIELSEAAATYPDSYGILYNLLRQKERAFDLLVCRSADRLGRTRTLISTIEELCAARGIVIVCVAEGLPASLDPTRHEGDGYRLASRGAASAEEVLRMRNRRDRGMRDTRLRDKKLFPGIPPFGYAYKDKARDAIIIDQAAAATVRRLLIDLYLVRGLGTQAIAGVLNAEGLTAPKGGTWTFGSVGVVLERAKRYAGWIEFNAHAQPGKEHVQVRGNYGQIISDEELAAIETEKAARFKTPIRRRGALSGVVICRSCGRAMTYHNYTHANGEPVQTLRCVRPYCTERVEIRSSMVVEALARFFVLIADISDPAAFIEAQLEDPAHLQALIGRLTAQLVQHDAARKRTLRAYAELGAMSDEEFVDALRGIERRAGATQRELDEATTRLAQRSEAGARVARFADMQRVGAGILADLANDPVGVNVWLRRHLCVWVQPGSRYDDRIHLIESL